MRNLYERLKPEYKKILHNNKEVYVFSIANLIVTLDNNTNFTDLSYSDIGIMVAHFNLKDFNPTTIANLFED